MAAQDILQSGTVAFASMSLRFYHLGKRRAMHIMCPFLLNILQNLMEQVGSVLIVDWLAQESSTFFLLGRPCV